MRCQVPCSSLKHWSSAAAAADAVMQQSYVRAGVERSSGAVAGAVEATKVKGKVVESWMYDMYDMDVNITLGFGDDAAAASQLLLHPMSHQR